MIAIRKILVPTDFSETAAVALTYAQALAQQFGAAVDVLHVVPAPYSALAGPEVPSYSPQQLVAHWEEDARVRLESLLTEAERSALRARLLTRVGHPFVEIVRYAREESIDLIVMGTHGRGAVGHLLLGSVAERVVRKAPCPVLTVRHPQHEFVRP